MARAKLYFTPQQKAEANRRKSAKYYAKNKDSINTKRQSVQFPRSSLFPQPSSN
ncbi:hypothetical protein AAF712_003198 [Marasmius tenuissimus]|uniref:Uncharacterized protein n=1 Tax=Marasmius tenuissimus TaxID=585030 RepID=A0ABR3A6E9_9AGAR